MAVKRILEYPDPSLSLEASPVTAFDADLQARVQNLLDTFRAHEGMGLCAPQIGDASRIVVCDASEDRASPEVFVNPVITAKRTLCFVEERCLSVPGFAYLVARSAEVVVQAQTVDGESFERQLDGMNAVCLQHEIDHLDGVLFVDRLSWWRRRRFRRAWQRRHGAATQTAA